MNHDELATRVVDAVEAIRKHKDAKKDWLKAWKIEHEILESDLREFVKDVRQMRLDEV